ncbi:MarR family winged helix-turn-helix transcriptional regulator [Maridesulfovibrio zosterae]|uniref:MarR family winged helix-turn-helix transcriptional regulator n=1 Tax=Maridesulfovibrio zosterae TaxID=82171 RepID=UPI000422DF2F|nr:MarR family transcriptional regulator [Maridesulfovibrio zosterae]
MNSFPFGYLNAQVVRLNKAILAEKLEAIGITYCQIGFLMESLLNPGRTQDELSLILSIDKGATARTIAKLEKLKFLYREENPDNRRQKLVYPTDKAKEIHEDLTAVLMNANEEMLSGLDCDEKDLVMKCMVKIIDTCREKLGMPNLWDII